MKFPAFLLTIACSIAPLMALGFNFSLSDSLGTTPIEPGKGNQVEVIPTAPFGIRTVVIDAGHGGHDSGCLGSSSQEKHLALAISLKVAKMMREEFPELNVILTRDKDVFVDLRERAAIANRNKADLFISIHCNYMPKLAWVKGTETYVMGLHTAEHNLNVAKRENSAILLEADYEKHYDYDPNSPEGHIMLSMFQNVYLEQSIQFATLVEDKFHTVAGRHSRGVKQAGFVVLKETTMPSVLIESGFLSNRKEEGHLKTQNGQTQIARAITSAFKAYKRQVERKAAPGQAELAKLPNEHNALASQANLQTPDNTPSPKSPEEPEQINLAALAASQSTESSDQTEQASTHQQKAVQHDVGPEVSWDTPQPDQPASPAVTPKGPSPGSTGPVPVNDAALEEVQVDELSGVQYRVQLAASPSPINTRVEKWDLLNYPVEIIREDGLMKYQIGRISSREAAQDVLLDVRLHGFHDAFVVAYRSGKRIAIGSSGSK